MRVLAALDSFIEKKDAGRTEEVTSEGEFKIQPSEVLEKLHCKKLFQELADLIDEHDSDAIKLVAKIRALLGSSDTSDNFQRLESQINSFKFEQAKEALEQTIKELNL